MLVFLNRSGRRAGGCRLSRITRRRVPFLFRAPRPLRFDPRARSARAKAGCAVCLTAPDSSTVLPFSRKWGERFPISLSIPHLYGESEIQSRILFPVVDALPRSSRISLSSEIPLCSIKGTFARNQEALRCNCFGGSARKAEAPKQERSLLILAHVRILENQKVETFLNAAFLPLYRRSRDAG